MDEDRMDEVWTQPTVEEDPGRDLNNPLGIGEDYAQLLIRIADHLWQYVAPCLLILGTLGNCLSIATLHTKAFRGSASGFVMTALAVADITVLNTGCLDSWLAAQAQVYVRTYHVATCKLHMYLTYLSLQLSPWTLVLITLERMVAVLWPLRALTQCSRRRMAQAWGVTCLVLATVNLFIPLTAHLDKIEVPMVAADNTSYMNTFMVCALKPRRRMDEVLHWTHLILGTLFPSALIFAGNAAIVYRLSRQRMLRSMMTGGGGGEAEGGQKTSSVTVMLLAVSAIFLLTTLPANVYFLRVEHWFSGTNYSINVRRYISHTTLTMLVYSNSAVNFLLYFGTGTRFRKAFLGMFCSRREGLTASNTSITTISTKP